MLSMRKVVALRHTKQNPLTKWADATWRYDYRRIDDDSCISFWTALIPYDEDIFTLKTRESWTWIPFSTSLSAYIRTNQETLHQWTLSAEDLRYLIGPITPTALPADQNFEWNPEDHLSPSVAEDTEDHMTTTHEE